VLGTLTVEPGAVVCGAPGAVLYITVNVFPGRSSLIARGTRTDSIVFTAENSTAPWGGITVDEASFTRDTTFLKYARVEYSLVGINGLGYIAVDSSRFRQIRGSAVGIGVYGGHLARSVIDTAGISGADAVHMEGGTFEENVVRGSGGGGVSVRGFTPVRLLGGRIEGSKGIGLSFDLAKPGVLSEGRPLRIVGGQSYPAALSLAAVPLLIPTKAWQDSLLGNAKDTLIVLGGISQGEAVARAGLPWIVQNYNIELTVNGSAVLRLEPGAELTWRGTSVIGVHDTARIDARGTAGQPIKLTGGEIGVYGPRPLESVIRYALMDSMSIWSGNLSRLTLDHITGSKGTTIALRSPGSSISASSLDRPSGKTPFNPAGEPKAGVVLGASDTHLTSTTVSNAKFDGVLIEGTNITVTGCRITHSARDGVRVTNVLVNEIHDCNFEQNAGAGVNNLASGKLDARNNWWGDPSGPLGPMGDGVSGNVDYIPFRTSPAPTDPQ
jgi:hypothetical protein